MRKDWLLFLDKVRTHSSLKHVSHPTIASSWCKVWDFALDNGVRGTRLTQSLFRVMSFPVFVDRKCRNFQLHIRESDSYLEHLCAVHRPNLNVIDVIHSIEECGAELLSLAETFAHL